MSSPPDKIVLPLGQLAVLLVMSGVARIASALDRVVQKKNGASTPLAGRVVAEAGVTQMAIVGDAFARPLRRVIKTGQCQHLLPQIGEPDGSGVHIGMALGQLDRNFLNVCPLHRALALLSVLFAGMVDGVLGNFHREIGPVHPNLA